MRPSLYALRHHLYALCTFVCLATPPLLSQALLPVEDHTLVTPVPLVDGFQDAQIAIQNRAPSAQSATISFKDQTGTELASTPISLVAHDLQTITFSAVLNRQLITKVRSIAIHYNGMFRTLASQIALLKYKNGASVDATFFENREFSSGTLNGLWWQPVGAQTYVAITNNSDSPQNVLISVDTHEARSVSSPLMLQTLKT